MDLPPTFSHSTLHSSVVAAEDKGEVGSCFPAVSESDALTVGETTGASFLSLAMIGGSVPGFRLGFFGAFFPWQTAER